jgi:hypothetical protein
MYPSSKQGNFGEPTNIFFFYAYLNRLFRRTMTHREGDETKILIYNKNILAVMTPNINKFEFPVFDFEKNEAIGAAPSSRSRKRRAKEEGDDAAARAP